MMELYSLIQLTPNMIIAGINMMFCNNTVIARNISPFIFPKTYTQEAIVHPKQKPLNNIIPNTIGIPMIVVPANHRKNTKIILFFISSRNSPK